MEYEQFLGRKCRIASQKSVLMSELDVRDVPHHVLVPVPPSGLGGRMNVIAA